MANRGGDLLLDTGPVILHLPIILPLLEVMGREGEYEKKSERQSFCIQLCLTHCIILSTLGNNLMTDLSWLLSIKICPIFIPYEPINEPNMPILIVYEGINDRNMPLFMLYERIIDSNKVIVYSSFYTKLLTNQICQFFILYEVIID